jgi:hypothetical protein
MGRLLKYKSQYPLAAEPQKATGFNDSFVFARGTYFVPLKNQQPKLALSEMEKLYPSWKVYQEWMGFDSSKNRYHSVKWLSTT